MLTTLDRYILREVIQTWVGVTLVLMLVMLASRFARYLSEAAAGGLPADAVFAMLGLTSIQYLTILVPISLFLAVMLALGRFYRDSEMVAMMACGVGHGRMLKPMLFLAVLVSLGLAVLSMVVSPWAGQASQAVRATAEREAEAAGFEAGRFRTSNQGATVFYAERVEDGGREMRNVFIQHREQDSLTVSQADRAIQRLDRETGERHLILYDGYRYTGWPGTADFQEVTFAEHGLRIEVADSDTASTRRAMQPTPLLWASSTPGDIAELQWRISVPLMGFLLVLLAVPLGRLEPRQGRYGKLFAAILVYILYSNSLGISQVWVERGQISPWLGLWWVHAAVLVLAAALVVKHYGWRYVRSRAAPRRS